MVPTDAEGRVEAFLEKAEGEPPTNRINAGAYVLEREVVEAIPAGRRRLVRARGLPDAGRQRACYGYPAEGYWIDIGTPERYLEATWDLLAGRVDSQLPPRDETGSLIYEGCLLSGAHIGPQTVLGRHCSVGSDSRVERSVLHDRVVVGADAAVVESVLAERRAGGRARAHRARRDGRRRGGRSATSAVDRRRRAARPGRRGRAGGRVAAGERSRRGAVQ